MLLLASLLVAGAIGGGAFWYGWARYTAAPQVAGEDQTAAVSALESAGLEVAFAESAYHSQVPVGSVIRTDPRGGAQVLPGDTVTLTLSLGPLLVPKVRGLDEDAAQDELLAVQLDFGESRERFNETQPAGTVLASVPAVGSELSPGDTVDLVISKGRRPIEVGSWVGKDVERAVQRLERRDLVASVTQVFDDTAPVGEVVAQSPTSGTLNKGDTVALTVSKGPELVEVPDVIRFGIDAAVRALEDAGFTTRTERNSFFAGLGFAVRTDPEPGSMAPRGSLVTIIVV